MAGSEIHLATGHARFPGVFKSELVDVHAYPGNEIHEPDQNAALTTDVYADTPFIEAIRFEASAIERRLDFFVLAAPTAIIGFPLVVLFVELPNQPDPAVGLVQ